MKKTKAVKKAHSPVYKATVINMGRKFSATGTTVSEAVLGLKPGNVKGRCILTIEKGEERKEKIIMPVLAFRLFNCQGLTRDVALKNISILLGI